VLAETADRERIELDAEAGPVGQDAGSIFNNDRL
jgi:hypothetical protein